MLFDEWAADQIPSSAASSIRCCCASREMGKTVIAISHDDHYFSLADRLLEMRQAASPN